MLVNAQLHTDQKDNSKSIENVTSHLEDEKNHLIYKTEAAEYGTLFWNSLESIIIFPGRLRSTTQRFVSYSLSLQACDWWLMIM